MSYFNNQFLFSETYIKEYIRDNSKRIKDKDESLINMFRNIVDWNKEFITGHYRQDPWENYIDEVLNALGFQNKEKKDNIRVLYTNPLTSGEKPVAICYCIDKEKDIASTIKGKYYAYNAIKVARENNVEWAMLTNGYKWRIYNTKNISPYELYLEIDIESSIKEYDKPNEAFQLFYLFFNVTTYYTEDEQLIIGGIKDKSDKTAETIEEFLRGKSEDILKDLCYGLKENMNKETYTDEDRKNIYNDAIILLYRLLFFGYAESRDLLPIVNDDPEYTESFERLCYDAKEAMNSGEFLSIMDGFEFWGRLDSKLRVYVDNSYNGGLFHNEDKYILREHRIANKHLVKCLAEISYNKNKAGKYISKIQYKDLSVRNLGSIYEGLLEYRLFIAEERMVQRKNKNKISFVKESETTLKNSDKNSIIEIGGIYLSQDAIERKETGAYYTPEDVVEYIVDNTVGQKLSELRQQLNEILGPYYDELEYQSTEQAKRTIQSDIDFVTYKFINDKILTISIIDSAMGSGHFLVNATYRVANEIVSIIEDNSWEHVDEISVDIKKWKRRVVENCIYGIDINELSVALARLSLWLISASNDKALSFIDHHLKCGDSIIGATKSQVKHVSDENIINIFDIIPDSMLEPVILKFDKIKEIGSSTKYDVEMQKLVYIEIEEELNLIKKKFDYYLATKYAGGISDETEYINLMRFGTIHDFEKIEIKQLMQYAKDNKFFHWELEFPQVFVKGGFDIAIGNPPYVDVSIEKYKYLSIKHIETRNLYSYILETQLNFLNIKGSYLSLIIPMSIITTSRMIGLRKHITKNIKGKVIFENIDSTSNPGCLFRNVKTEITILTLHQSLETEKTQIYTTNYQKFFIADREGLFDNLSRVLINKKYIVDDIIPKLCNPIEMIILDKIFSKTRKRIKDFKSNDLNNCIYYRNTGRTYYKMAFDEPPLMIVGGEKKISSTLSTIKLNNQIDKEIVICLFYSSLFYWFWIIYSNCHHTTVKDIDRLPIDLKELMKHSSEFKEIHNNIKGSLLENGKDVEYNKKSGLTQYFEYKPRYSKDIFDKIDKLLAKYYGLSEKEINFIINYDLKFRINGSEVEKHEI